MKIPIIPFYKIERAVRMLPIIKDVFTPTSTESESDSLKLVRNLKDTLHDKNADIFNLRQKIKRMKKLLFSNNEKIKELEKQIRDLEDCNEEYRLANKYT